MFNRVIVLANLTRDIELRYTPAGTAVAKIGIAINDRYKDQDKTVFIDVIAFGKLAETCNEYLQKGRQVLIEGKLSQNRWETEEGEKRSKIEIIAQSVRFMSQGSQRNEKQEEPPPMETSFDPF